MDCSQCQCRETDLFSSVVDDGNSNSSSSDEEIENHVGKTRKLGIKLCASLLRVIGCTPVSKIGTKTETGGLVNLSNHEKETRYDHRAHQLHQHRRQRNGLRREGGNYSHNCTVEFEESYFKKKEKETERLSSASFTT